MRSFRLIVFLSTVCFFSYAQKPIKLSIYSAALHDSIYYRVTLPDGWNADQKFPVIYLFEQLSLSDIHTSYLATLVRNYNILQIIPKTIIVTIDLRSDNELGYDYPTGNVTGRGKLFWDCICNSIIPAVEKKFKASNRFRAYFGHSQGASYGAFLFLQHPEIFNTYLLFSPEQLAPDKPPFSLQSRNPPENLKPQSFYLAYAGLDMERRQAFGRSIAGQMRSAQAGSVRFAADSIPEADHLTLVMRAAPGALEFIFKPYLSYFNFSGLPPALPYFLKVNRQLDSLYGFQIEKNNRNASFFTQLAAANKDLKAMNVFVNYFETPQNNGLDLFNLASGYNKIGADRQAAVYFRKAIRKSLSDEKKHPSIQNPITVYMSYRSLAMNVYQKEAELAWSVLNEAARVTRDRRFQYFRGKLAIEQGIHLDEGISSLKQYVNSDHSDDVWKYVGDQANYLLGKGYLLKGDKSKAEYFFKRALAINSDNEAAKKDLEMLVK